MNKDLLIALAHAVAANEKAQRRFRTAVLIRLSNIETMAQMIHAAQIYEAHHAESGFMDKIKKHSEKAESCIEEQSKKMVLTMVRYIYGESEEPSPPRRGRKRKWSHWEI